MMGRYPVANEHAGRRLVSVNLGQMQIETCLKHCGTPQCLTLLTVGEDVDQSDLRAQLVGLAPPTLKNTPGQDLLKLSTHLL